MTIICLSKGADSSENREKLNLFKSQYLRWYKLYERYEDYKCSGIIEEIALDREAHHTMHAKDNSYAEVYRRFAEFRESKEFDSINDVAPMCIVYNKAHMQRILDFIK